MPVRQGQRAHTPRSDHALLNRTELTCSSSWVPTLLKDPGLLTSGPLVVTGGFLLQSIFPITLSKSSYWAPTMCLALGWTSSSWRLTLWTSLCLTNHSFCHPCLRKPGNHVPAFQVPDAFKVMVFHLQLLSFPIHPLHHCHIFLLKLDPGHFIPLLKTLQCLPCLRCLCSAGVAPGSQNSSQATSSIPGRCPGFPTEMPFLLFLATQISLPLQGSNQMSLPPADVPQAADNASLRTGHMV